MEIHQSARKHGITTDVIRHALDLGTILELVLVPAADPDRVIHADRLRPSLFDYLR